MSRARWSTRLTRALRYKITRITSVGEDRIYWPYEDTITDDDPGTNSATTAHNDNTHTSTHTQPQPESPNDADDHCPQ